MIRTLVNRIIVFNVIISLLLSSIISVYAEESQLDLSDKKDVVGLTTEEAQDEYEKYIFSKEDSQIPKSDIIIESKSVKEIDSESALLTSNNNSDLLYLVENGCATYEFFVSEPGFYNFVITYLSNSVNASGFKVSISIDDRFPFSDFSSVEFNTYWENSTTKNSYDNNGNELTPEQVLSNQYVTERAKDSAGVIIDPYKVFLTEGSHKITITALSNSFGMKNIGFCVPEEIISYNELKIDDVNSDNNSNVIYIEGEDAILKSSNSLVPKSDSSASINPQSAFSNVLNYIGSTTWQSPGQKVIYNFTVENAGYYKIAFNYKQSDVINGESFRWMKIDNKTPFEEAKNIKFPYAVSWKYYEYGSEDNPYYIWLDEGEHTLSLEVTLGEEVSQYYKKLEKIVSVLGELYTKIAMITGDSPDINRDYELFKQLPDLEETLKTCHKNLDELSIDIKNMSGKRATQYSAALDNMKMTLKNMYSNPYYAHHYVTNYYSNYCTVSSWLYEMKQMPLSLDQIQLVPANLEYPDNNNSFLGSLLFSIKRFIASFTKDYNNNVSKDNEGIEIWVNWGVDQASTLKQMVQDSFTPSTGIPVNIRVTNASLIKGIMSGNFPDLSLHLSRTEPVNLGIRGALYDLSQFDDYEEVIENFGKTASIPYQYNGEVYALPDTQSFYVMFYRSDILDVLGLEVPKTWDEFIKALTVIQHRNMQVYIPYTEITSTTTVHTGLGGLSLFPTLLGQKNIALYNDEKTECILNSSSVIDVFDFWTNLYKDYNCLKEANFYNRFKVGTMPLGIAPYSTYLTLKETAPEIEGDWGIALVPGFDQNNHTVAGSGTGCGIVNKSPNKDEAWEFLKWWVSKETQLRYSNQLEALLGLVGRVSSANVSAVKEMDWDSDTREILLSQWEYVEELPEVPGSYYLTRAIDQAFWASVNDDENTKATLSKWEKIANQEIERKVKEYIN